MKFVIIGAGQTGRGFIAPILFANHDHITFIDKNAELIEQLNKQGNYNVRYFGNLKPSVNIHGFDAIQLDDPKVLEAIAQADIVTTSVFMDSIGSLIPYFKKSIALQPVDKKLTIICIENGVDVKRVLMNEHLDAIISEGIIFCTSVRDEHTLDIASETYPECPIDGSVKGLDFSIPGLPLVKDFGTLIQRKIYTYNFFSAAVAYLGSYVGADNYADAANHPVISNFLSDTGDILNKLISKKYNVNLEHQINFGNQAILKFKNKFITDSIKRNAQQVARKLEPTERLLVPLKLAIEQNQPTIYFDLVIAAAVFYGEVYEKMNVLECLGKIEYAIQSTQDITNITVFIEKFRSNIPLEIILKEASHGEE